MSFTLVTVTARYRKQDGTPASGTVSFRLSSPLIDGSTNEMRQPVAVDAVLDVSGSISVPLTATNNPTTLPSGVTYRVIERITGADVRSYSIEVPYDSAGATLDLADVVPSTAIPTYTYVLQTDLRPIRWAQPAEGSLVQAWRVTPFTTGSVPNDGGAPFSTDFQSWPNSGVGAGTYNHSVHMGFNAGRHSGSPVVNGKPAIHIGWEDNYYGQGGDLRYGVEWYVQYFSADGTSQQLFRPFFTRVFTDSNSTSSANTYMDIGADASSFLLVRTVGGGQSLFLVTPASSIFYMPVNFYIGGSPVASINAAGAVFSVYTATGQDAINFGDVVNRPKTLKWSTSSPFDILSISSKGNTAGWAGTIDLNASYSAGTVRTGLRVIANADGVTADVSVIGKIGFYGTVPPAKQVVAGSRGGNAALAALLTALAAYGLVTDSSTA